MPKKFAKLFETEKFGQILIQRQRDDDQEIAITFDPGVECIGYATFKIGFPDTEQGEAAADAAFEKIGEAGAIAMVEEQSKAIQEMFQ